MLGFNTNSSTRSVLLGRILQYVSRGWLPVNDERLKAEVNAFVFNSRGRPQADTGKHDDMIFATALALIGMDQTEYIKAEKEDIQPASIAEILQFEMATGKLYKNQTGSKPDLKSSLKALYH
jgi:FMN-dependent NADH-azoreductase